MDEILGADLRILFEANRDYVGLGADFGMNRNGDLDLVSGRYNLGQALLHRLLTRVGELGDIGHPDYGSRLHELIGRPNNEETRELVRLYIKECISQEIRVQDIISIRITVPPDDRHTVLADITVLPIYTNHPMNLVFPFYLEVI
jgi:phage baseplate assembly protein W